MKIVFLRYVGGIILDKYTFKLINNEIQKTM